LSLESAMEQALASNYQIQVQRNQVEIAANNASLGNAGLLPSLSVGGSAGGSVNNTDLEFAGNIPPTSINAAKSATLSGNANVSYVLFNGLSGQRTYQRLKLNRAAVDAQSRASVEATILQVAQAYYQVLQLQDQLAIATDNATISKDRYQRAKLAHELGSGTRTALLAARVDLTSDSASFLNASLNLNTARRNLSRLMGVTLEESTVLTSEELSLQQWTLEELEMTAMEQNAVIKNLELQSEIAQKNLEISWSSVMPTISLNGGYNYTNQQNEAGILLKNVSNGWNGNIGLSYTLFNGFRNQTTRQNAQVLWETSELMLEDQKLQLKTDLANVLDAYQQSMRLLMFEEQNLESSALNLERASELLRAGQITNTQFREAQSGYTAAQIRISNAKIAIKLNELQIMRLTGQILSSN
jgi:outer membrane protein